MSFSDHLRRAYYLVKCSYYQSVLYANIENRSMCDNLLWFVLECCSIELFVLLITDDGS